MTARDWEAYGYTVLVHEGHVYLFRPNLEVGYTTEERGDTWMRHLNLNRVPWRFIDFRKYPEVLARFRKLRTLAAA